MLVTSATLSSTSYAESKEAQAFRETVGSFTAKEWTEFQKDCEQARIEQAAGLERTSTIQVCNRAVKVRRELETKAWINGKVEGLLSFF